MSVYASELSVCATRKSNSFVNQCRCLIDASMKVEIALAEVGANFTSFEVDLQNKPVWYAPQVNPASKVNKLHSAIISVN